MSCACDFTLQHVYVNNKENKIKNGGGGPLCPALATLFNNIFMVI
jgi:hypothetical protein